MGMQTKTKEKEEEAKLHN